jgi:hypothetical protein
MGLPCIRTSLEWQILDTIRVKLCLPKRRLEAPLAEANKQGRCIRHCRLRLREKGLASPLYLGLDLDRLSIHFYFHNCLYRTRKNNFLRYDGNYIYAMADLEDPKSLTCNFLRQQIDQIVKRVGPSMPFFPKPFIKLWVCFPNNTYTYTPEKNERS